MLLHRGHLISGFRSVSRTRPQSPYGQSRQWYSPQPASTFRYKTSRKKTTLGKKIWISVGVLAWGQVFISYVYEPLRDNGVFTNIAKSTVFRVIPPKLSQPTGGVRDALYEPINGDKEIRLLVLEPGARSDALECHLINAELSWRTRFEALSYAWGDDTSEYQLTCSRYNVDVRSNPHGALLDLRHPRKNGTGYHYQW